MPELARQEPAYAQIANYYRNAIASGELPRGAKLPSITDIANQWHVARATAANAITRLQVERAVYSSPQGTFVSSDEVISRTPGDRIKGPRPVRIAAGETVTLTEAGIVTAPDYVAGLLGLEPGSMVVRREEATTLHGRPQMLAVDWVPTTHVMVASDLLADPLPDGPAHLIASITGRHVTHAQDHLEARNADTREATALKIPPGSPVLAGVHVWSDTEGVILYGEWVMPPKRVITYTYEVSEPDAHPAAAQD
ncbi:MAG: GntR family transcriptional regulator [Streptosporangiaceae bacterium]